MVRLAALLLRSLLTSLVGLLVVVGAAHAHDVLGSDCGRHGHHPAALSMTEAPEASGAGDGAGSFSGASGLPFTSDAESEPCEQGECDHGSADGCCGMACHAAVANADLIFFTIVEATNVDPAMNESSLHGRLVGPGDRPPRSV
jgi:hypothetical protein